MKFSDQFCTREQSAKLVELGIIKDTPNEVLWIENASLKSTEISQNTDNGPWHCLPNYIADAHGYEKALPAFSVAELGVMLPATFATYRTVVWGIASLSFTKIHESFFITGATEAFVRAEILIKLLTDGAILAEDVNERLNS